MTEFVTTTLGDRVAYDRYGEGPALIFIAGAGQYRAIDPITTPTAELAAERDVTAIVYDRLGRGESAVEGPITLDRELAAIAALIDLVGGEAVLCGHSSGCSIALAAAAHELPIAGLVLWEAPVGGQAGGAQQWSDEVTRLVQAGDLEGGLVHYMKDMPPEWLEGARQSPMFGAMVAQVGSYRPDGESLAWAETAVAAEALSELRMPVQIIVGTQTMPVLEAAADLLERALPNSSSKRLPGANHAWQPQTMADDLAEFVRETAGD